MQRPVVVMGSLNMDLVVTVPRHPKPGETILGGQYAVYPGGKGANQAVAAAQAGSSVKMLGLVGNDSFGVQMISNLEAVGVDASDVDSLPGPSGVALITVDAQGENSIVVSPGANSLFLPDRIPLKVLESAAVILLQLEIPLGTIKYAIRKAATFNIPVLLNPAPAHPLPDELLKGVQYLILNETEVASLSEPSIGLKPAVTREDALSAAWKLRQQGAQTVIVTLGQLGVVWSSPTSQGHLPAHPVEVVDTTAAGDAFCGSFAAAIAEGQLLEDALRFANAAGAIAVTRPGAQPSLGKRSEIEALLHSHSIEQSINSP